MKQVSDRGSQTLWAKHNANQLHAYFAWAFAFLDANSVDAFKNDAMRGNLLNDNGALLPEATDSMPNHKRLADRPYSRSAVNGSTGADTTEQDADDNTGSSSSRTSEASPANGASQSDDGSEKDSSSQRRDKKDERCLYSGVRLPHLSTNIQRLLREAKSKHSDPSQGRSQGPAGSHGPVVKS